MGRDSVGESRDGLAGYVRFEHDRVTSIGLEGRLIRARLRQVRGGESVDR